MCGSSLHVSYRHALVFEKWLKTFKIRTQFQLLQLNNQISFLNKKLLQLLQYHHFVFAVENCFVAEINTLNFTNKTLVQIFPSEQISLCHCTTTLNRTVGRRGNTPTVINGYMEKILLCFVSPLLKRNKQCAIKTPIAD